MHRRTPDFPGFSVIVPTYQRREVVLDTVRALAAADYPGKFEIVVVVDGSTDGTTEALARLEVPRPLRVIAQDNAGAASARNRGAAEAKGEVLLFVDDDMICQPDILREHARSHAERAAAVLGHIPLDPGSPDNFLSRSVEYWANERLQRLANGGALELSDLLTGQISVRRDVFEALGGFDHRFTAGGTFGNEDLDFGLRLIERHRVRFNPRAVSRQRYIVTPAQYLRQWRDAGAADVALARKHPARARELFGSHGATGLRARVLARPLAAVGPLGRALGTFAAWAAQRKPKSTMAARLFYLARDVAYWSGVRAAGGMPDGKAALVLCYHAIADLRDDPILAEYGVASEAFAGQLDDLLQRGHAFVGFEQLRAFLAGEAMLPRRAVLVTFDDCYAELPRVAQEILRPRGIPALAFAVTDMASGTNEWDQPLGARKLELLDAEGLARLRFGGVEIGSHSRTHRSLVRLEESDLAGETAGASEDLVGMGLPRPRAFAYPYGERDGRAAQAVRAAGYGCAFGLRRGRVTRRSDPFDLPRVEILARDRGWRFRLKTAFPALSGVLK